MSLVTTFNIQRRILAQLKMSKAKKAKFMPQEDQKTQIQRLDDLANIGSKPNVSDTNTVIG